MKKVACFLLSAVLLSGFYSNTVLAKDWISSSANARIIHGDKDSAVIINTKEIKFKDKDINIDLKIPVIEDMADKKIQSAINAEMKKTIMDFKNSILSQAKKDKNKRYPYDAVSTYYVHYNKNNILSIVLELYSFTGGAHGMTYRVPFNIDLKTGKHLALKDIFKDRVNYKEIIDREISKKIAESEDSIFFKDAFKGITENQLFYIKPGALVIYFPLYEIAPYVAGFPEFEIPFPLFNEGITIPIT